MRNVRVLARAGLTLTRLPATPPTLATALRLFATAVRAVKDAEAAAFVIVGQLRSTAIDLMRGVGANDVAILTRVDEALGLPPV